MLRDLGFAVELSQARFLATVLVKEGSQRKKLLTRKLIASLHLYCLYLDVALFDETRSSIVLKTRKRTRRDLNPRPPA